jgi:curli biogenesis system outer membrane secretion channel CsgG
MFYRRTIRTAILLILGAHLLLAQPSQKPTVAVHEFDYSTVMTSVQAIFGTQYNVGRGIKALLTNRLTQDGKYTVVERANLDVIMKEQDFLQGNRAQQGSGAQMGKIKGADVFLMGDITTFGRDDQTKQVGGVAGAFGSAIGGFGMKKKKSKAVVVIAYRLINATTGEVIVTAEARGESQRDSNSFKLGGSRGRAFGAGGAGMESSNFAETIIGEAVTKCVDKLGMALDEQAGQVQPAKIEISALVAKVTGAQVIFTAGKPNGVYEGQQLEVHKVIAEVKHPVTGEALETITEKVGDLTVSRVSDSISFGTFTGSDVQVGYQVKTP